MDDAAEPVAAENPDVWALSGLVRASGRRTLLQRPVRTVAVVMIDVLIEDGTIALSVYVIMRP